MARAQFQECSSRLHTPIKKQAFHPSKRHFSNGTNLPRKFRAGTFVNACSVDAQYTVKKNLKKP